MNGRDATGRLNASMARKTLSARGSTARRPRAVRGDLVAFVTVSVAAWIVGCGGPTRPVADPGPERTAEVGETVAFDGSASRGEITSYLWDFGDGTPSASGVTAEHAYDHEGDFSASLTVRGPGGAHTGSAIVHVGQTCLPTAVLNVVTPDPQPAAPIQFSGGNSTACSGQTVVRYHWDFGDGAVADGADQASPSHTYAMKGTYDVALDVYDGRGSKGRATRTLNVGVISGKPLVQCSGPTKATTGVAATYTAQGSDPGGGTIAEYDWSFSDDGSTPMGASTTHTFVDAGPFIVLVTAKAADGRVSDPCEVDVTVTAPVDHSGTYLLNPSSPSMMGCSKFTVPFPATTLALTQTGTTMSGTPSGNNWPSGTMLTGEEDPAMPGTWRIRGMTPQQDKTSSGCSTVTPDHSVKFTFPTPTTISGTWTIVHSFSSAPLCNCNATGTFTGVKQ